jgi:NRPS condensation-like uncharacterized protein
MEDDWAVIGPTQRLVHFMDRVSSVNFVVVADLNGPLDAAAVERGAAVLQARHPLLRVRVEEEGGRVVRRYHFRADGVPAPEVRAAPADTFSPGGLTREVEAELARPFAVERGPLFRLALAPSLEPDRHRLLLTMHHMIADGASASIVIRDLLEACAGRLGATQRPLFVPGPSFPGVGRVRALWSLARLMARTAAHLLTRRPTGRPVPGLNAPAAGRETGIIFRELDREQTAAMRAAAREEGTTVGGMLSAAIVRAVHAAGAPGKAAHVALVNAVNVRDLASADALDRVDLLMSFVVTYHRVGDARGFFDLARECSAEIKRAVARGDAVVPHTLAGLLPSIEPGEAVRATIRVADRFATSAALTNVGPVALPSGFGPLTLTSLSFAPSLGFLGRFSGVASTFDGRLSWNFAYVKQVVGRDLAERIAALSLGDLLTHAAPWLRSA